MKHSNVGGRSARLLSAAALAVLAACGGGDGDQAPRLQVSRVVSFGDSLSDVGSYRTAGLTAAVNAKGGFTSTDTTHAGRFTVNGADARNWIELLAAQYQVAAPCAAQTGLTPPNGSPFKGVFDATPTDHADCYAYAQGGARVTNPVGPGNAALGATNGAPGQLTTPVVTQVAKHLAKKASGNFDGDELVMVLAGGNDLFINLATYSATVGVGGDPTIAAQAAATAMVTAGTELAALVKTQMAAKGATHIVVVNLPDVSLTPGFRGGAAQPLVLSLATVFNTALSTGLSGTAGVLLVDAFTQSQEQFANPSQYGVSNVMDRACVKSTATILYDSALVCNSSTVVAGDVSHYQYADDVHPTPYGYRLLAQLVTDRLIKAGWL